MTKRRSTASVVVILAAIAAALLLLTTFVVQEYKKEVFNYIFYNDTSPETHTYHNSGNVLDVEFLSDILETAPAEVRIDPANNVDWFKNDLFNRIYDQQNDTGDPVLLAQLAVDASLRAPKTTGEKILPVKEQTTEEWEAVVLRLISDNGEHIATADKLLTVWNRAERVTVTKITGSYTSMGYQIRDGIELEDEFIELLGRETIPMPVLKDSQGVTGWEITFHYVNGEKLSYRIDCGYQPDSTNYGKPPVEQTPKPTPDINININDPTPKPTKPSIDIDIDDPTPTPTRPPTTNPPTTNPPTTTTPEPKDPDKGPQGQNPDNPDYGGGPNEDNDTEIRPEPSSPATYTPPPRPTPQADDDKYDTPADNNDGIVENNDDGHTETIEVDTDGDGEPDDIFTGEVDVGDPFEDTLDDVHEDPPAVEPGLDDGQNTGEIGPPR